MRAAYVIGSTLKAKRKSRARMLGFKGPAQPSPALGDALNAGYLYLEVRRLGCDTHQTVARYPHPRTRALHALQGLFAGSGISPTSAVIWSRYDRPRFRRLIRRQHGGRGSGNHSMKAR